MTTSPPRSNDDRYKAAKDHATLVNVPDEPFLSIEGHGSPYDPAFQGAMRAIYSVAYTVHFDLKKQTGVSHKVPPLEALWWWGGEGAFTKNEKEWRWRLMLRQPRAATKAIVERAKEAAKRKHPEIAVGHVELRHYREGPSMQILHVGPYKDEATTIARLHEEIEKAGYEPAGMHHEIYLGDPRRARPENLRTLVRQPVKPASGGGERRRSPSEA